MDGIREPNNQTDLASLYRLGENASVMKEEEELFLQQLSKPEAGKPTEVPSIALHSMLRKNRAMGGAELDVIDRNCISIMLQVMSSS